MQRIKDVLVGLGPRNPIVRFALKLHGRRHRFTIGFPGKLIAIRRGSREILLAEKDFYLVPIMLECFDQTFEDIGAVRTEGLDVLNFSKPGSHTYKRHGITLSFPGMPEDDSIAGYTHWYAPAAGDRVFDIGAHAGFTACMFARMVGPSGRVIAFEPDAGSLGYLEKNIAALGVSNVTIVAKAVDAKSGTAVFNADGTMGAGLVEHSIYGKTGRHTAVETISLEDACIQFGIPQFVKIDIEGAELAVIEASAEFLKKTPVNLAFDSYHRMRDGRFTWMPLEPILRSMGYEVGSSEEFGQMFTWARVDPNKTVLE